MERFFLGNANRSFQNLIKSLTKIGHLYWNFFSTNLNFIAIYSIAAITMKVRAGQSYITCYASLLSRLLLLHPIIQEYTVPQLGDI